MRREITIYGARSRPDGFHRSQHPFRIYNVSTSDDTFEGVTSFKFLAHRVWRFQVRKFVI